MYFLFPSLQLPFQLSKKQTTDPLIIPLSKKKGKIGEEKFNLKLFRNRHDPRERRDE